MPRAQRDRISFEILHRDGEAAPAAPLTRDEICSLDRLVETEEAAAAPAESSSAMTTWKRVALRQAEVGIGVFGGLAAVNFLPLAFWGLHAVIPRIAEVVLITVGLAWNGAAFFLYRRIAVDRVTSGRTKIG